MRKARFTEHQIIAVIKSVEAGRTDDSSVVQSVERRTVNPYVTGSSPVRGAKF